MSLNSEEIIVRRVLVNRYWGLQEALDATKRQQRKDAGVYAFYEDIGETKEENVYFFKVGSNIKYDDLGKQYELRGLMPADPYAQAAVNQNDPAFADTHPNTTCWWSNAHNHFCVTTYGCSDGERWVLYDRLVVPMWGDRYLLTGLHKEETPYGYGDKWRFIDPCSMP